MLAGGHLLYAHEDSRLAGDARNLGVRECELHAHRRRQAEAHGAQTAGVDPAPRLVERVELRREHLVLAHVRGQVQFAVGHLVQGLHRELRLDHLTRAVVAQAIDAPPVVDLLPPGIQRVPIRHAAALAQHREHVGDHAADGANDRHVHLHGLRDRRRVDIDMDDLRMRAEVLDLARHAVIESGTDGDQAIGLMHGHVGLVGAMHAEHPEELLIGHRVRAEAHQRARDRIAEAAHQLGQRLSGIIEHGAAAGVEDRPLGRQHRLDGLADLAQVPLDAGVVGADAQVPRVVVRDLDAGVGDVLGDIDDHRAGTAGLGDVKGLADGRGQVVDVLDKEVVLHAGTGDADRVHLLEGVATDDRCRHLTGDDHQRDRVHMGGRDTGHGVGRTGPRGDQADTTLSGGPGIAIGGMGGPLLMADQDVLDLVTLEQRIVDMQHGAAGIAEHVLDAFVDQRLDRDLGTAQHRHADTGGRGLHVGRHVSRLRRRLGHRFRQVRLHGIHLRRTGWIR